MLMEYIDEVHYINELEVSITDNCHLNCDNCGFNVPKQPYPSNSTDTIEEMCKGLEYLDKLNIRIKTLVVLGGEPSFHSEKLLEAIERFAKFQHIDFIELVTHGLSPQNIEPKVLKLINKLSISVYFDSEKLILLWKKYIATFYTNVDLDFRVNKKWDRWLGDMIVSDKEAQKIFDDCWYKKHCITLERSKLFICSRIAKLGLDNEGLDINQNTTIIQVEKYLNKIDFLNACKNCIPMMKIEKIEAGKQPDNRILKMLPLAVGYLTEVLNTDEKI